MNHDDPITQTQPSRLREGAVGRLSVCGLDEPPLYTCPGEAHAISRSVHYARMAAFYPLCRQCVHRQDTGHLPRQVVERIDRMAQRAPRSSLLSPEGIRGVYLNEMTRERAAAYASGFARLLWNRQPRSARLERGAIASRRRGPVVVVGQDERPSAADLAIGVAAALRRMGIDVIDIGTVSTPCFWYAVDHLQASGGVHVTGHGFGPAVIGADFVEERGIFWSLGGTLDQLDEVVQGGTARTARHGGSQRMFQAVVPYRAGLLRHFHALRPLQVCVVCLSPLVAPILEGVFASLPCRLSRIEPPVADDAAQAGALALARLSARVRDDRLHAGFLIADDGQRCQVVDERGAPIATAELAARLSELAMSDGASPVVVLDEPLAAPLAEPFTARGWQVASVPGTREQVGRALRARGAVFGAEASGRFWFADATPCCDAVVTLARVLQALSRSDAPASRLHSGAEIRSVY